MTEILGIRAEWNEGVVFARQFLQKGFSADATR
jgi:hypothetical protein